MTDEKYYSHDPSMKELFDLEGRVAVITGGAGQLARFHASALAEMGANVVLWDFRPEPLKAQHLELEGHFPGKIHSFTVDITEPASLRAATQALEEKFSHINILINNAGIVKGGHQKSQSYFACFEDYDVELWELALKVNMTGTFMVTQYLAPLLKKSAGKASIINIASDVGIISPDHRIYQPNPDLGYPGVAFNTPMSYAVSKSSLIHMTKYWATYWARDGIRVNAISPAGVEHSKIDPLFQRELIDRIPMGRMARANEFKGAVLFLSSDASSFVTGINLIIDGGRTVW